MFSYIMPGDLPHAITFYDPLMICWSNSVT